ncbi:hypothetical protein SE37_07425 [Geobacter soli]|uniref:Uncharacterized protein n=1 Tax=Geobacter soli TaxID=1510391 RepID=A0A0C1TT13_9BACT|nr:hypothetical protein SE37_07425 [Geobacter soli]
MYELADHFACYNTFSGTCDFRIPIARMEECEFEPFYISMKHLLHGGLQVTDCDAEEGSRITHAILIRAKDGEWEILIADGVLPQCYAIGHRTPIGYAVGSCPACGDSVIDQGDRFACSSGVSGCNFSIAKKSILDSVSSSIIDELHDAIIGSDSLLAENMSNVLASGGTHKTSWYDYEIYEYYEMAVMKKGDGWTLKITHDDAELEACAREGYRKMLEE